MKLKDHAQNRTCRLTHRRKTSLTPRARLTEVLSRGPEMKRGERETRSSLVWFLVPSDTADVFRVGPGERELARPVPDRAVHAGHDTYIYVGLALHEEVPSV